MKEVSEPSEVTEFLEPAGTVITAAEAVELEDLLRRALVFLPEKRLASSELAKHYRFVGDFQD